MCHCTPATALQPEGHSENLSQNNNNKNKTKQKKTLGSGVYSKVQNYLEKNNAQKYVALLWQGKCTQYGSLQGTESKGSSEGPGQSSGCKCSRIRNLSQAQWHVPIIPSTREAKVGGWLEPRSSSPVLMFSLKRQGNIVRTCLLRQKTMKERSSVFQISSQDSRNGFLTPASAKDFGGKYPSAGLLAT